ncbi:MAG TPA: zinc-binding dehydrogenase [Thermoanaerobaculia bacterium]|nr:zinc-binding dehydrogenase [Thermoanaerobaculia bacterium]
MTSAVTQRRVARALRAGGPEVIEVGVEDLAPLEAGEVLVRVEAAGLNHAETLILSGKYVVRVPFPWAMGGEGAGTVVATGADGLFAPGTRVCWAAIPGSCADYVAAPASMLARIPDPLSFEQAACLAVAGLTAEGLTRVWPLDGRSTVVVWGAAGAVGRMLVALLADRGVDVIGIARGDRVDAVRAASAVLAIDRDADDVDSAVRSYTNGEGAAAVFDPIGAATFQTSLQLLAPRGCLINYGELSGPVPPIDLNQLFPRCLFVTKYNGTRWVEGLHEFAHLIEHALDAATKRPAVISDVAGRFPLEQAADAYSALEKNPRGKILVLPQHDPA